VDLYAQHGSAPNTFEYDCRGVNDHNNETCNLNDVRPGNYYILVYGAKGGFENVTLEVLHQE
jgi:vibriolysin